MGVSSLSRRYFLGGAIAAGAGYMMYNRFFSLTNIYASNTQVILHAAYHLFPVSSLGPGAEDLHIAQYLVQVFEDQRILKEDKDYFLQGAYWLEESAFEIYDKSFLHLTAQEKESLFQEIAAARWGENFIHTVLTYVFEALLSAPVYGSNTHQLGWKWLEHTPGFPLPQTQVQVRYAV